MAKVKFTTALKRFFPELEPMEVNGDTIQKVLEQVEDEVPGIKNYVLDEKGALRRHVNIFLKDKMIRDRARLSDKVGSSDEILIYQALSGG